MSETTFWSAVTRAARDGIVLGVKYGFAAVLAMVMISLLLGDYTVVRQRAANGQIAFEYLQKVVQQQTTRAAPVLPKDKEP